MATLSAPNTPSLADPVTFTGPDAEAFLAELPDELDAATRERLRASAQAGAAAMSPQPANELFA